MEQLRNFAPILGPDSKQLQKLRDLAFWQDLAHRVDGLGFPETAPKPEFAESSPATATAARWLRKSISGSGGLGVQSVVPSEIGEAGGDHYFQREVRGRVLGACLILPQLPRECELAGVTESWTERDWPGPTEFIYRGSFGPIPLSEEQNRILLNIAEEVRQQTGLRGWLGVDFIEDADGNLWLLELNPRWTAGMEILARADRNPVPAHLACFTPDLVCPPSLPQMDALDADSEPLTRVLAAKAVVYAERELRLGAREMAILHNPPRRNFADIPRLPEDHSELLIEPGHPILTVRCDHQKLINPREELLDHLRHLYQQLSDQIPDC
ncbi:MAG: ATP-grasp domain-containing protein [Planctomycetota bacterium]